MADISMVGKESDTRIELKLIEGNRPTPLFLAIAAIEISIDLAIAYGAYRFIRYIKR